VPRPDRAVRA